MKTLIITVVLAAGITAAVAQQCRTYCTWLGGTQYCNTTCR
jgi:hypothetical protein